MKPLQYIMAHVVIILLGLLPTLSCGNDNQLVTPSINDYLRATTSLKQITTNDIQIAAVVGIINSLILDNNSDKDGRLNDTGITRCSNVDSNDLDCPVLGYPQQDAEQGSNTMSFTTITEGRCVKDNTTGLIWEVKQDKNNIPKNSLHDADDLYTWYDPDSRKNGGYAGSQNDNVASCYGHQYNKESTYCNTYAYVRRVNAQGWCGYSDWRLPSLHELLSIVHYGRYSPAIDTVFFPNTKSWYWSSSSNLAGGYAWFTNFTTGLTASSQKYNYRVSVRLVRSGK